MEIDQRASDVWPFSFTGESWEDHVNEFITTKNELEDRLWYLGSIAASITRNYGDKAIPEFARDVGYSARRVWELASTWKAWENCDRAQDFSFKHHTIAGREDDPEAAIEKAYDEKTGRPKSVREFEESLSEEKQQTAEKEFGKPETLKTCPHCGALETAWEKRPE